MISLVLWCLLLFAWNVHATPVNITYRVANFKQVYLGNPNVITGQTIWQTNVTNNDVYENNTFISSICCVNCVYLSKLRFTAPSASIDLLFSFQPGFYSYDGDTSCFQSIVYYPSNLTFPLSLTTTHLWALDDRGATYTRLSVNAVETLTTSNPPTIEPPPPPPIPDPFDISLFQTIDINNTHTVIGFTTDESVLYDFDTSTDGGVTVLDHYHQVSRFIISLSDQNAYTDTLLDIRVVVNNSIGVTRSSDWTRIRIPASIAMGHDTTILFTELGYQGVVIETSGYNAALHHVDSFNAIFNRSGLFNNTNTTTSCASTTISSIIPSTVYHNSYLNDAYLVPNITNITIRYQPVSSDNNLLLGRWSTDFNQYNSNVLHWDTKPSPDYWLEFENSTTGGYLYDWFNNNTRAYSTNNATLGFKHTLGVDTVRLNTFLYSINGSDPSIYLPNSTINGNFSLSFFMYTDRNNLTHSTHTLLTGAGLNISLLILPDPTLLPIFALTFNNDYNNTIHQYGFPLNTWFQLGLDYNAYSQSFAIYVNGQLAQSHWPTPIHGVNYTLVPSQDFTIHDGHIDNVILFRNQSIGPLYMAAIYEFYGFPYQDVLIANVTNATTFYTAPAPITIVPPLIVCPIGFFYNSTSNTCLGCGVGTYQDHNGTTTCINCTPGRYQSSVNSTTCIDCTAGHYQSNPGTTSCSVCAPGTFQQNTASTNCLPCIPGYYQNVTTSTSCVACDLGMYQDSFSSTGCLACAKGSFQSTQGSSSCLSCTQGHYNNALGSIACLPCDPGMYQPNTNTTSCIQCSAGTFQNATGGSGCYACEAGSYSNTTQSISCTGCAPGSFQPSTNTTSCTLCAAGRYQSLNTTTACISCGFGSVAPFTGSTVCTDCQPGNYEVNPTSSCQACAAGTYTNVPQAVTCLPCDPGSVQPNTGQQNCTACGLGKYQSGTNRTVCQPCLVNTYGNTTGLTVCYNCTTGTQATSTGSSSCTNIIPGTVTDMTNLLATPNMLTWTPVSNANLYLIQVNGNPVASTASPPLSIAGYDPDTVYNATIVAEQISTGATGALAWTLLPKRPTNVQYTINTQTGVVNVTWTGSSGISSVPATYTYTIWITRSTNGSTTIITTSQTTILITGLVLDSSVSFVIQAFLNEYFTYSSPTINTTAEITYPTPDTYQQYLFHNNDILDTSYNTFFTQASCGCTELYSNDTTIRRPILTFPNLGTPGCSSGRTIASIVGHLTPSFSISFWMNSNTSSSSVYTVIGTANNFGYTQALSWSIQNQGDGYLRVTMVSASGLYSLNYTSSPNLIPFNSWIHVVVTFEHTTGVSNLYWNKALVATTTNLALANDWTGGSTEPQSRLNINSCTPNYFAGKLSEVQVFDIAVNTSQVHTLYNTVPAIQTVPTPTSCTLKLHPSITSANITFNSASTTATRVNYTTGQAITLAVGDFVFINDWQCPQGTVTNEDTVGFGYRYDCSSLTSQNTYNLIAQGHCYPYSSAACSYAITWFAAVLYTNVTCAIPLTGISLPNPQISLSFDASLADASSNHYTVTSTASDQLYIGEPRRGAVELSQTTTPISYLSISASATLSSSYTISAWVYVINPVIQANGIVWGSPGFRGYANSLVENAFGLTLIGNGVLASHYINGSALLVSSTSTAYNVWYHWTVTYDSTNGVLTLWRDGQRATTTGYQAIATFNQRTTFMGGFGFQIGTSNAIVSPPVKSFQGYIDQFMVYNTTLTTNQVYANFLASYIPLSPPNALLIPLSLSNVLNTQLLFNNITWTLPSPNYADFYLISYTALLNQTITINPVTTNQVNKLLVNYSIPSYTCTNWYSVSITPTTFYNNTPVAGGSVTVVPPCPILSYSRIRPSQDVTFNWIPAWTGTTTNYFLTVNFNNGTIQSSTISASTLTLSYFGLNYGSTITVSIQTITPSGIYSGPATLNVIIYSPTPTDPYIYLPMNGSNADYSVNHFTPVVTGNSPLTLYSTILGRLALTWPNISPPTGLQITSSALPVSFTIAIWQDWSSGLDWLLLGNNATTGRASTLANAFCIQSYDFNMVSTVGVQLQVLFGSGAVETADSSTWNHFAVTFDATSGTLKAYHNGVLSDTKIDASFITHWTGGLPITIGSTSTTSAFGGYMNEFYVFDHVLSVSQILSLKDVAVA